MSFEIIDRDLYGLSLQNSLKSLLHQSCVKGICMTELRASREVVKHTHTPHTHTHTYHTWMIKVVFSFISKLSLFLREVLIEGVLTDHYHLLLAGVQVCLTKLLHDLLTHRGLREEGGREGASC